MLGSVAPTLEHRTAQALSELSRSAGADWEGSLRRILQFDAEVLHVERVSFWSLHEETSSIHCDAGFVASVQSFEHGATLFEPDLPEYFAAMREARLLDMADVQTDPRCRGLRAYCASRGIASMLDVPVWLEGRLCGVVCHEHVGATRSWSAEEEDFVTSVSQVVSSVLAARAHTRAEEETRRVAFLDSVSRLASSLDAHEIGGRAVSLCVPWFADFSSVVLQTRGDVLELAAMKHRDPLKEEVIREYLGSRSFTPRLPLRVMRQGQSLLLPDMTPEVTARYGFTPEDRVLIERLAIRSAIAVPLAVGDKVFGVMSFAASDRQYGGDDLAFAENIGSRVAAALENARLYAVAREAVRARDELLVVAAHELRTPLTALQLRTDQQLRRARRGADPAEKAWSENIARDVRRFSAVVDHILDALRIRGEGVALMCARFDLATVVRGRVRLVAERARAAASPIALDSVPEVTGCWDKAFLEKVIDVLLDNAIKFGSGRPIAVSLRAEGTWAELVVRDQGMGIPADRLPSIFRPFERAVSQEHFGGLGLGLYVAKAIVDAHGGSIEVASRPGEGTTLTVRLPLSTRSEPASLRGPAPRRG
jgi:signal transduction histidine kinase